MSIIESQQTYFGGIQEVRIEVVGQIAKASRIWGEPDVEWMQHFTISGQKKKNKDNCGTLRRWTRCAETGNNVPKYNWCFDKHCSVCYGSYAHREANKITQKIRCYAFENKKLVFDHWVISPPIDSCYSLGQLKTLKRHIKKYFTGGYMFFHSHRLKIFHTRKNRFVSIESLTPEERECYKKNTKKWLAGAHLHIICPYIHFEETELEAMRDKLGATVKRVSSFAHDSTEIQSKVSYELSHIGVHKSSDIKSYVAFGSFYGYKPYELIQDVKSGKKIGYELPVECTCKECSKTLKNRNRHNLDEYEFQDVTHNTRVYSGAEYDDYLLLTHPGYRTQWTGFDGIEYYLLHTMVSNQVEQRTSHKKYSRTVKVGKRIGPFLQRQVIYLPYFKGNIDPSYTWMFLLTYYNKSFAKSVYTKLIEAGAISNKIPVSEIIHRYTMTQGTNGRLHFQKVS